MDLSYLVLNLLDVFWVTTFVFFLLQMFSVVLVTVLCATSLVVAKPVELVSELTFTLGSCG